MTSELLKKIINEPVSGKFIADRVDSRIITYKDLESVDDIMKWLDKPLVILYRNQFGTGHWVTVFLRKEKGQKGTKYIVEFFDSYGNIIDDQLKWQSVKDRVALGQKKPKLSILLEKALEKYPKLSVEYSHYNFQKYSPDVSTCGRWVVFRLMNKDLSLTQFKKMIDNLKKKSDYSGDEIVALAVSN